MLLQRVTNEVGDSREERALSHRHTERDTETQRGREKGRVDKSNNCASDNCFELKQQTTVALPSQTN